MRHTRFRVTKRSFRGSLLPNSLGLLAKALRVSTDELLGVR
jgi:hypothetical protein